MSRIRFTLSTLALFTLLLTCSSFAHAQATRTWVSAFGDDANPCSRTAPCKTFAGSISKTAEGGEIDVIDPGSYGTVTITKAITIDGTYGAGFGAILALGTNGINVNIVSGNHIADAVVTLRHLSINGANQGISPGLVGISVSNVNRLNVEECYISNFNTAGIRFSLGATNSCQAFIKDTSFNNTTVGISSTSTGGITVAQVNNCKFFAMADGYNAIMK